MRDLTMGIDLAMAWLARRPARALAALVLAALILFLPGFARLPVTDRDEARFAQASRQMLASGDLIDIRFQDAPRHKKPVGIYWLQAAAVALLQGGPDAPIWMYRVPSLCAGIAIALLTYAVALPLIGGEAALWAALLMAAGLVMGGEARLAKTDASLTASILACVAVLVRLYQRLPEVAVRFRRWMAPAFWACLAASVLLKGPVGPMVVGMLILVLAVAGRNVRWLAPLRPKPGLLLLALLVLPWFVAITVKSGGSFWTESLVKDLVAKTEAAQESHGAPPGAYLAALWVTFWPGALLLAAGLPTLWRGRSAPLMLFALAWLVPGWIIFEATPTKLIHYVLPLYPALALLTASAWQSRADGPLPLWGRIVATLAALALPLALFGAIAALAIVRQPLAVIPLALALIAVLALVLLFWQSLAADQRGASVALLAGLAAATWAGSYESLARIEYLWPSDQVAARVAESACPDPLLVTTWHEPSLVFRTNRKVQQRDAAGALQLLAGEPCAIAIVDDPHTEAFRQAATANAVTLHPIGIIEGFAIGAGKPVTLSLYAASP